MVLNYHPANYIGWPIPAGFSPPPKLGGVRGGLNARRSILLLLCKVTKNN